MCVRDQAILSHIIYTWIQVCANANSSLFLSSPKHRDIVSVCVQLVWQLFVASIQKSFFVWFDRKAHFWRMAASLGLVPSFYLSLLFLYFLWMKRIKSETNSLAAYLLIFNGKSEREAKKPFNVIWSDSQIVAAIKETDRIFATKSCVRIFRPRCALSLLYVSMISTIVNNKFCCETLLLSQMKWTMSERWSESEFTFSASSTCYRLFLMFGSTIHGPFNVTSSVFVTRLLCSPSLCFVLFIAFIYSLILIKTVRWSVGRFVHKISFQKKKNHFANRTHPWLYTTRSASNGQT